MKIIHMISGGDVGGAKSHIYSLLGELTKTEQIRLICFMDGSFATDAQKLNIPVTIINQGSILKQLNDLKKIIQYEGFEIVHCHGSRANMMGALLKNKVNVPIVTTVHSDYKLDYLGRPLANLTYGNINRISLKKFDYYIGISEYIKRMLISRGFNKSKIFSLYNGVNFKKLIPALTRDEFLNKFDVNYNENSIILGIAARISPVKDMETLIRSFAVLNKSLPDTRLIIAGDGEDAENIKNLAKKILKDNTYKFIGWIDDTDSFYNAIDINLLTSLSEAFPCSLPEGAKMRCATIASNVGGVPDLIKHNKNGLLFEPKDVDTLSEYMILLCTDNELRNKLSDNLFNYTKEYFSTESVVKKQKEIYEKILNK